MIKKHRKGILLLACSLAIIITIPLFIKNALLFYEAKTFSRLVVKCPDANLVQMFDFDQTGCYRYTVIGTSKMPKNKNALNGLEKAFRVFNQRNKGYIGKVFQERDMYETIETFDMKLLSDKECKDLYIDKYKGKTKKEISLYFENRNEPGKEKGFFLSSE